MRTRTLAVLCLAPLSLVLSTPSAWAGYLIVNSGMTLSSIALDNSTTEPILAALNDIEDPNHLEEGQHLLVPQDPPALHMEDDHFDTPVGGSSILSETYPRNLERTVWDLPGSRLVDVDSSLELPALSRSITRRDSPAPRVTAADLGNAARARNYTVWAVGDLDALLDTPSFNDLSDRELRQTSLKQLAARVQGHARREGVELEPNTAVAIAHKLQEHLATKPTTGPEWAKRYDSSSWTTWSLYGKATTLARPVPVYARP